MVRFFVPVIFVVALSADRVSAQVPVRSFAPSKESKQDDIPKRYLPPAGMCRIWIDSVPPSKQPAPTDCPTAIRNKPSNGRVIFSEKEAKADSTEKPKKPDGSNA